NRRGVNAASRECPAFCRAFTRRATSGEKTRGWPDYCHARPDSYLRGNQMKLAFSQGSPFARKVRIAAIELGLIDKIEMMPTTVVPTQPNEEYSKITPLKKLPVLILDNGEVILDSGVIV